MEKHLKLIHQVSNLVEKLASNVCIVASLKTIKYHLFLVFYYHGFNALTYWCLDFATDARRQGGAMGLEDQKLNY